MEQGGGAILCESHLLSDEGLYGAPREGGNLSAVDFGRR